MEAIRSILLGLPVNGPARQSTFPVAASMASTNFFDGGGGVVGGSGRIPLPGHGRCG